MSDLATKHCKACSGEENRLNEDRTHILLRKIPGWEQSGGQISKLFQFKNYHETIAFVNAIAWIAHREDHHPDLEVGYNKCRVRATAPTRSAG